MKTLYINCKVSSLDSNNSYYESIGVIDDKISFLGSIADSKSIEMNYDTIIDLKGKLVLPGFNDSHLHVLGYGMTKNMLLLETATSITSLINLGKSFIINSKMENSDFLLGRGWNQDKMTEKRFPTKFDLDQISQSNPIILRRVCGHVAICNSKTLELIPKHLLNNPNIDITDGVFKEDAIDLLNQITPLPTKENIKDFIQIASKELLSYGITSVQTDDFCVLPEDKYQLVLDAYSELSSNEELNIRVYEQCLLPKKHLITEFLLKGYNTGAGNNYFKIGPLKLLLDGALGSKTAKLDSPYLGEPDNTGIAIYSQDTLNDLVKTAHDNNMQVAVHGIGDGAINMILDSIEYSNSFEKKNLRHGIVHCQITNMDIIKRMAHNNVLAYIQPIFLDYDLHIVESRIGIEKSKETYIFKTMLKNGIRTSGGSDAPVVHFNIFENLYSAITRKDLNGYPEGGWLPDEKLTIQEALKLFTIEGAYASFEEDIKGTLELGKLADFIILDKDLYTIPCEDIPKAHVLTTIVGGKVVYNNSHL